MRSGLATYGALYEAHQRHECDRFVEDRAGKKGLLGYGVGELSDAPGGFVRLSLVNYFELPGSERDVAWRCAEPLSLRESLG